MSELYPYQETGVRFLVEKKRALLADDLGIGKSRQAIEAARRLGAWRILVVAPSYALGVWQMEVAKWWPEASTHLFSGPKKARDLGWESFVSADPRGRFLLAGYANLGDLLERDRKGFDLVIADEAHWLANPKTQSFKHFEGLTLHSPGLFLLSATPIRRSPFQVWSYLHLIDPREFPSYWKWVHEHLHVFRGQYGLEILGPKRPEQFREILAKYCLRRRKEDVLEDLPKRTRVPFPVVLSPPIRKAYNQFVEDLILTFDEEPLMVAANRLVLATRLRQLLTWPPSVGISSEDPPAREAIESLVAAALEGGESVAIFSPFVMAATGVYSWFHKKHPTFLICGEQDRAMNDTQLRIFQDLTIPGILVSTLAQAASWTATKASVAIFHGFSWSPIDCFQAEGRLDRIGQTKPVTCYYMLCEKTIDRHIVGVLDKKTSWARVIMDPRENL